MQIFDVAAQHPDKAAVIMAGSGHRVTYAQLLEQTCRLANCLRDRGLRRGDRIAVMMENSVEYFEVLWAAMISGLYLTPVNSHLSAREAAYMEIGRASCRERV